MLVARVSRHILKPQPIHLFGEPLIGLIHSVTCGVTLDIRLTWSPDMYQVRKKAAQKLGVLYPLLSGRSGLAIRNTALLYKQLICQMMD